MPVTGVQTCALPIYALGIIVASAGLVHREDHALASAELGGDRVREIGRERRDAATARERIADERQPAQLSHNRTSVGWPEGSAAVCDCEGGIANCRISNPEFC